jgi:hypothetical protein
MMDFTAILTLLKEASPYDLYRLRVALKNQMDDPEKIKAIRQHFSVNSDISYFNSIKNSLCRGMVLRKNLKKVVVMDREDTQVWTVSYYAINLTGKESDIQGDRHEKLTKNNLRVNDRIGFDHEGKHYFGIVNKLNHKTASVLTSEHKRFRVGYGLLFKVIEGEMQDSSSKSEINRAITFDK